MEQSVPTNAVKWKIQDAQKDALWGASAQKIHGGLLEIDVLRGKNARRVSHVCWRYIIGCEKVCTLGVLRFAHHIIVRYKNSQTINLCS